MDGSKLDAHNRRSLPLTTRLTSALTALEGASTRREKGVAAAYARSLGVGSIVEDLGFHKAIGAGLAKSFSITTGMSEALAKQFAPLTATAKRH